MKRYNFLVTDEIADKLNELIVDKITKDKNVCTKTTMFIELVEKSYKRFNGNK